MTLPSARAPEGVPESRGLNLFEADPSYRGLLELHLEPKLCAHLLPHFAQLGAMAGGDLDELALEADKNPPVLNGQRIEKSQAYKKLEEVAFAKYGLAAMSHRGGVLGWPEPLPPAVKYALTYVYVQAEFGVCCPLSMTDALTRTIRKYADPALVARYLPGLTSQDLDALTQGAMFITEQQAGSDVGLVQTLATREKDHWLLSGDKWFCSNVDAGLALVLARPEGAPGGTAGLSLFLLPRTLPDGSPNRYRIVRLKDKLGTRDMPSGEIKLEGALAWLVGDPQQGFKQMTDMINMSRLSNGMRAAGMMRRALTEALFVARRRMAFGKPLIELPLMRRQLLKLMLPAEAARSVLFFISKDLEKADAGDELARRRVRLLTPLIKFRACRDARRVTADAMEVRGGAGYIEEWSDPRLVRDAHLGSIWEGTSNIVALDVLRAIRREKCLEALLPELDERIARAPRLLAGRLAASLDKAAEFAHETASTQSEAHARQAATGLYYACAAALLADEGTRLGERGDARRQLLAFLAYVHRLAPRDPLRRVTTGFEAEFAQALLPETPIAPDAAERILTRLA
ncbi:MAG: DNA alkylation response protein [Betaproteobacteria bacterium RBG_16_66_20]|nr:MAG: DNA alkylation response protein [Betaproteobacteria bacterium RBG_16_66_20]